MPRFALKKSNAAAAALASRSVLPEQAEPKGLDVASLNRLLQRRSIPSSAPADNDCHRAEPRTHVSQAHEGPMSEMRRQESEEAAGTSTADASGH